MRLPLIAFSALAACATAETIEPGDHRSGKADDPSSMPWKQPSKWPYHLATSRLIVHYQAVGDLAMAKSVLADVEHAWQIQFGEQGARPPLDDRGEAGPDGRFDVYLSRGIDELYVTSVGENPATEWDDCSTAMVLDPWGRYGGAEMRANVFHELRHASQGVDDWGEHISWFEADATLWETVYFGYERLTEVWADYQAHPSWSPFRDDRYRTWFMYGGGLFLLYLRQHVFAGSLAFTNAVWLMSRNPAGTNEPDFIDGLDAVLAARGTSTFAELVSFARARWYTGARANGTLEAGDVLPAVASTVHTRAAGAQRTTFVVDPQPLGTVYTVVKRAPTDGSSVRVSLASVGAGVKPVVQLVGQGSADRVLDLAAGAATVPFVNGSAVLAVTMLPATGSFDPDTAGTQPWRATVALEP